jgi:hypothetical protein
MVFWLAATCRCQLVRREISPAKTKATSVIPVHATFFIRVDHNPDFMSSEY